MTRFTRRVTRQSTLGAAELSPSSNARVQLVESADVTESVLGCPEWTPGNKVARHKVALEKACP
jgi:hypothetical protein